MQCAVKEIQRRVSIVTFRDEVGAFQGRIVPAYVTRDHKPGDQIEIPRAALDSGIEYGQELDFDIILGGPLTVSARDIQNAMRAHGIWTAEDFEKNPKEVHAAIQSVVSMVHGRLVKAMRKVLGG